MSGATTTISDTSEMQESRTVTRCPVSVYSVYVLVLLLVTYLLNQLDRYMLGIVAQPMAQDIHYGDLSCMINSSIALSHESLCNATSQQECESEIGINGTQDVCKWEYNGQGFQYELLAGPVFIVVYTLAGIPVAVLADLSNRRNWLVVGLALWSAMALLTGFATEYWHVVVTRFLLGVEAGCTPLASSLIADYFIVNHRALALSFYNWGIYIGYSMSYAVGNLVTLSLGWRWAWIISGIPGLVVAGIILLSVREPDRSFDVSVEKGDLQSDTDDAVNSSWRKKMTSMCCMFLRPSLLVLCLAGSIRNAAGYVWAYNTQIYFQEMGVSPQTIASYMSWIPLVFGCIGVSLGGFISDRIVKRVGVYARIGVLIASQALAVPFTAGTLFFSPPLAFISLIPAYVIGEMWVGITLAVVIEVVPASLRTSAVAVYLFIISNIGGNMPLLVPPLTNAFATYGYNAVGSLRAALYILYPGLYLVGALLFVVGLITLRYDLNRISRLGYETLPND